MKEPLLHETKIHGTKDFPYIVYHGIIPDFFKAYPLHWHDEVEIIYITKGKMKITIWSKEYRVNEGDIVILMPQTIHSFEQIESSNSEYFNILFSLSLLESSSESACYNKYIKPFIVHEKNVNYHEVKGSKLNKILTPLICSLIEHRRDSYTNCEYLVKSNLYMIMHHLNQNYISSDKKDTLLQIKYEKIKNALYHVQNSYSNRITVKEVADLCGFSESHFMKLFKELTSMSFNSYLINYRLEMAGKQIKETDHKIVDIASNCGFDNHSYFTRSFQKKYGLTPAKYRETID